MRELEDDVPLVLMLASWEDLEGKGNMEFEGIVTVGDA